MSHAPVKIVAWLFVLTVLFFSLAVVATGFAAAETDGNESATNNETTTELYDQLFNLNIHDVEFIETDADGHVVKVEATWTGDSPERITVTQLPGGSSSDVAMDTTRLAPGDRTVFRVDLVDDSDAILYTTESINEGRALRLSDETGGLIEGPWSATDAQVTGAAGLFAGLGVTTVLAVRKVRSDADEPERIL